MQIFKDRDGREWQVVLNVFQMKRVRAALGVDLINVIELDKDGQVRVDMIDKIANDPCLLVDILWVLVQDQARTLNVTDEQFGTALAGDAIENATKAFLDELVDFFPGAKRLFLQKAVGLARKFGGEWNETLKKALEDPELESRVRESMNSSTSSPGPSEQARTRSPCGNSCGWSRARAGSTGRRPRRSWPLPSTSCVIQRRGRR